jgi:hypothetical protein
MRHQIAKVVRPEAMSPPATAASFASQDPRSRPIARVSSEFASQNDHEQPNAARVHVALA